MPDHPLKHRCFSIIMILLFAIMSTASAFSTSHESSFSSEINIVRPSLSSDSVMLQLHALEKEQDGVETMLHELEKNKTELMNLVKSSKSVLREADAASTSRLSTVPEKLGYLEAITKDRIPPTCEHVHKLGVTTPGSYTIDPDGHAGEHDPIEVYCEFEGGEGVTVIPNDEEGFQMLSLICEDPKFLIGKELTYKVPEGQISSLAKLSGNCSQDITFEIEDVEFQSETESTTLPAWWTDSAGREHPVFGFVEGDMVRESESEVESTTADTTELTTDTSSSESSEEPPTTTKSPWKKIIKLSSHEHNLPVKQVRYKREALFQLSQKAKGDVRLRHEVGPLKCRGKRSITEEDFTGCDRLYDAGVRNDGFQWINLGNTVYQQVYCDMSAGPSQRTTRSTTGPRMQGTAAHFYAVRRQPFWGVRKIVTYDHVWTNAGNGLDPNSGRFKAPTPGVYYFHFQYLQAIQNPRGIARFCIVYRKKSANCAVASSFPRSQGFTTAILNMKAGEQVYVRQHNGGSADTNIRHAMIAFSGSLMDAA